MVTAVTVPLSAAPPLATSHGIGDEVAAALGEVVLAAVVDAVAESDDVGVAEDELLRDGDEEVDAELLGASVPLLLAKSVADALTLSVGVADKLAETLAVPLAAVDGDADVDDDGADEDPGERLPVGVADALADVVALALVVAETDGETVTVGTML